MGKRVGPSDRNQTPIERIFQEVLQRKMTSKEREILLGKFKITEK